jgi:hypothetical protein
MKKVVGIVTFNGPDGLGIKFWWQQDFLHLASHAVGTGSFPGVKWPGHGVDHTSPPSAEVKEGVELYLYSTSGPSWPVLG